ncbi:hypothetical protein [Glycomyces xiaoerkulensis]|uniref:hypothetical protein n=1 Tax=Glycomyces xiaoerkulensis TaxID=2038139 RepID=UPI000C264773|nr:hypothetical protein [Glycomyces xiaoerkulensis]
MERPPGRAAARPPRRVQALRLLLAAQTVLVAALWLWTWRALQGQAWAGGVETELFERGMSYLVTLAPALPVNLLAVYWLGKGGFRARLYLTGAAVLAAVQQILLLVPVDPGRSVAAGVLFALTVGPVAFAAVAIAATAESQRWLRTEHEPARPHLLSVESLTWGASVILGFGVAVSVGDWVTASTETGPPVGEHDESDVWARIEAAVTTTAVAHQGFPGFHSREVEVTACGYRTESGLQTYRYRIAYGIADFDDPADETAYTTALRDRWSGGDYEVLYRGTTRDGRPTLTAHRGDDLTFRLLTGEQPLLEVQSGCLERVDDSVPCLDPQGEVPPERDTVVGLPCTGED